MNALVDFVKTIGAARLAAMGALAAVLVGIFIFLTLRFTQPQMTTLFSELPIADSGTVVRKLDSLNIPYELRNDGGTILVPKDKVLKIRMSLAEEGLPAGRSVGYEVFDRSSSLGTTNFVQNVNYRRALEGELARTIRALDQVRLARVHLVLPKRQLFARNAARPSASIVLKLRGDLTAGQVRAIQHLVASGVKNLRPERVSIVDESGTLLASGEDEQKGARSITTLDERTAAFEKRLKARVTNIVNSVVGRGKARVQVTAEMDFNRVTQTSETYDPDGQVVRSTQTRRETAKSKQAANNAGVSAGNELPAADGGQGGGGSGAAEDSEKSEEVVNYEISRTTKTETTEAGRIKRISVAVLVDGLYSKDADGKLVYAPRDKKQIDQIAALIRSAVGFDRARGDVVEVDNIRFAPAAAPAALEEGEEPFLNLDKQDYFNIAELFILLVLSILVLLFVVRPLLRRIVAPDETLSEQTVQLAQSAEAGEPGKLTGPENAGSGMSDDIKALIESQKSQTSTMIEAAQVAGEVHTKTMSKIGDLVDNNPEEAIAIVRQWLQEKAA